MVITIGKCLFSLNDYTTLIDYTTCNYFLLVEVKAPLSSN